MEKEEVTLHDALEHGLLKEEFEKIIEILGRTPNSTELGIFSGMWSEHCSYKNSILKLKTLPTWSELSVTQTGEENAGALDIGDGYAVVFKIESHNHPTAVEPYQGAATGVGGIMRDIFTMGARPFISLNSLRFGYPTDKRNEYLLKRSVKGIGDYGNSLGIAVSGGELYFDSSFNRNPLVNAMSVGFVKINKMAKATTDGKIGYPVYIVGATTGRDGIHGASFASKDLTKESEEKRSAVQVGDPFMEKLLMEATLEVIEKGYIVGIQDMGAAGISCSTSEMSAKGKTGMEIDLDLVPYRETGMNAYEAMLSESQERMLVIPHIEYEKDMVTVFQKWDLHAVKIGTVTDDGFLVVKKDGKIKAKIPANSLVLGGGAPRYVREEKIPDRLSNFQEIDYTLFPNLEMKDSKSKMYFPRVFEKLISSFNVCSRKALYEQYDTDVGLVKVIPPGGDGGLARVPGTNKGIAVSTDCNSTYTYLDPYLGTIFAVCEAARNVVVTGAKPIGISNNLNFANPYIPENYFIFSECIRGMADSCRFLGLPVTGGNVSFYNESPDGPVFPTPTIGMVGLLDDIAKHIKPYLLNENQSIAIIGRFRPNLGGSEYLREIHETVKGEIPSLDLQDEFNLQKLILTLNESNVIQSAKDISLGGLLVALAKMAFPKKLGLNLDLKAVQFGRMDEVFFGETAACIIIGYDKSMENKIASKSVEFNLQFLPIGKTDNNYSLEIRGIDLKLNLNHLEKAYEEKLVKYFQV